MDYKTGKWRFLYKKPKNKKPTRDKALFETAIEAAFARDSKIHNDPIIKNANKPNFTLEEWKDMLDFRRKRMINTLHSGEKMDMTPMIKKYGQVKELTNEPSPQDIALANAAFVEIQGIFLSHYQNALLEAANYIAKTFFNDDVELVRKKTPAIEKKISFNQLCERLKNADSSAPSKSWLYNALGLFVDEKDLSDFHTYGKLPVSHRVKLLTVHDIDQKKKLAKEIENKNLTVRQLQEKINKAKGKGKSQRTYQTELKAIKKELQKRLAVMKDFPEEQREEEHFNEIEEAIAGMIAMVDELIEELGK